MWMWGERAYANVWELSEEGESQLSSRARRPIRPPPPPSYSSTSLASTRATGEWDAEKRVGFAAHGDATKAARDRSSSSSSSSSSPSPSLPYALHASIAGATRTPPRARPRVNREVPPVSMRTSGGQDEVGGCPLLAHLCVLQRRFRLLLPLPRVRPGCGRRYQQAYSTVSAARGPFSLLLAVGTPADRRAAETAKARSRIATPSSGPDSAVQRISDAVVAPRPPIFVLSPFPFSFHLYSIPPAAVPITIPEATKTDDTSERKPARIGTHIDGAEARRQSGSGRRGREALNGARLGGETLRGEWAVRWGRRRCRC